MGILLFLIDTSASMALKTYLGTSYLDVAKAAVETFMKYRMRDPASRGDRYMLVTFDEPPYSVKSGWKENHSTFVAELKATQAAGLSSFSVSIREAFKLLNIHRLHTGIENYGQGRNPFYLEPAVIISITDGHLMTNANGTETELILQDVQLTEGNELTKEIYRWDQRFFSVVLRLPGMGGPSTNPKDPLSSEVALAKLAEATGGKSYIVSSQRSINQCMESLTQKLHPGVVVHFQKMPISLAVPNKLHVPGVQPGRVSPVCMETEQTDSNDSSKMDTGQQLSGITYFNHLKTNDTGRDTPPPPLYNQQQSKGTWVDTKKMIYVKTNPKGNLPTGHWPIPESFWPDISMQTLIPRDAHPVVWFDATEVVPLLVENFPFDKYELEPSLLTQHILEKRNSSTCWQVYVENSGSTGGFQYPFGYLKASSNLTAVNLFIMPYNYPKLIPLIDELARIHMRPSSNWRAEFADYLTCLPCYYVQPLRNALRLMGAPLNLIPDGYDGQLSYSIQTYLRKLKKQAKIDSDRYISSVVKHKTVSDKPKTIDLGQDIISIAIGAPAPKEDVLDCKSPLEITRIRLLQQLSLMRARFLKSSAKTRNTIVDEVNKHELPIGQMGNYQEHLKKINPLREVDSGLVRTQLFGNPFKLEKPDKRGELGDVADEHMVEQMSRSRANRGVRRSFRGATPPPSPKQEIILTNQKTSNTTDEKDKTVFEPVTDNSLVVEEERLSFSSEDDSSHPAVTYDTDNKETNSSRKRPPSPNLPVVMVTKKSLSDSSDEISVEDESRLVNSKSFINKPSGFTITTGQPQHTQVLVRSSAMPPPKLESSASKVLTEEFQKQLGQENSKLRSLIIKEVRRPGKNFEVIFQHLDNVKGSITIRKNFVMDIVKEAKRFKKKPLIEKLEEWAEQLESKKLSSPSPTSANKKKEATNNKLMGTQRLSESGNNNGNREPSWKR